MFWSLSLQLMPDESIIEDSTKQTATGLKPTYTVFLTNKRAAFRFDGFGSSMTQSFTLDEIVMAQTVKRMFISYLELKTRSKTYFLHIPNPDYWSARVLDARGDMTPASETSQDTPPPDPEGVRKERELLGMLDTLRRYGILNEDELEEKRKKVTGLSL